ncbi:hypothetical protein ABTW24_13200 [Sphingobacterium thalpophilum]|uniref:Uncharacterized protein n=1 Tax=Sphingobacterium thalpophilum TaxID=259 RepID=A0ABV4HH02_9SPHI
MGGQDFGNYLKLKTAFSDFGMPVFDMTEDNFLNHPIWDVFTFGIPPVAIDIMLRVKGVDFEENFRQAILFEDDNLKIRTLHKNSLIQAKKFSNRPKDIDDIQNLTDSGI